MSGLALTQASKSYGDIAALDGLELAVRPGRIHAIVGLNGAGKTTAMKALVRQVRLDAGSALVGGTQVGEVEATQWAGLGHIIDRAFGYPELSVRANIVHSCRLHGMGRDEATEAADAWIERVELGRWRSKPARHLSLGNRQRLGLACALAHAPTAIILDEPTNGLDPAGVLLLRDLLLEAQGRDATVLVSSHHLDEVARVADDITIIHAGRAIGTLDPGGVDLERTFFETVRQWDEQDSGGAHR